MKIALDDAAKRWPEDAGSRAKLLLRLAYEGHRSLVEAAEGAVDRRREAIVRTSGSLTGMYGPDYLADLRKDWPA